MIFDRVFEKDVALTGIGQSEVAQPSTKFALRLSVDAALEAIADAGFSIFSNPSSSVLAVQFTRSPSHTLSVVNVLGETLWTKSVTNSLVQSIDVSALPRGIYFLLVKGDEFQTAVKWVRQ